MPEVAVHLAFGGFPWTDALDQKCGHNHCHEYENRDCPELVAAIRADPDDWPKVEILSVPEDADWYISEYDGFETIREGRTWPPRGDFMGRRGG